MSHVTDEQIGELLGEIYEIGLAKPDEQIAAVRRWVAGLGQGISKTCPRCGVSPSGTMGYLCPHSECPSMPRASEILKAMHWLKANRPDPVGTEQTQPATHELLKKVASETWGIAVEEGYYGDIQPLLPDDMAEKIIQDVLTEMRGHLKDG